MYIMDRSGNCIVSGSSTGHVYGWNTLAAGEEKVISVHLHDPDHSDSLEPTLHHLAHSDAVNGVR